MTRPGRIRTISIGAFVVFLITAAGIWDIIASKQVPIAEVPETTYDLGEFFQDQAQSHTFIFRNTGRAPLLITRVKPDCRCTLAHYDQRIPPGGEGKITLAIAANSLHRKFHKRTRVHLNDPQRARVILVLTGVPKPIIDIDPHPVIRFQGKPEDEHRSQVRLISHLKEPVEIYQYQTNIPRFIEVSLRTQEPGKAYLLEVRDKTHKAGNYSGIIELFTTAQRQPRLLIRVFGILRAPGNFVHSKLGLLRPFSHLKIQTGGSHQGINSSRRNKSMPSQPSETAVQKGG